MPELPEVECVRRSLDRRIVGRRVVSVRVTRPGVVRGSASEAALLCGQRVDKTLRHGKQLALVGDKGAVLSVHLGMSGQLCVVTAPETGPALPLPKPTHSPGGSMQPDQLPPHTHVLWRLDDGTALRFTDPRRFGGLWTFAQLDTLVAERWSVLGPDALAVTPAPLHQRLSRTRRGLKAALLDQHLVAGLGNIYVDELLFALQLHPLCPADTLNQAQVATLVRRMRSLLNDAIQHGGSSLRDYVDAENRRGNQQTRHRVYGRGGRTCMRRGCRGEIQTDQIAGRTTAWCPVCQRIPA